MKIMKDEMKAMQISVEHLKETIKLLEEKLIKATKEIIL